MKLFLALEAERLYYYCFRLYWENVCSMLVGGIGTYSWKVKTEQQFEKRTTVIKWLEVAPWYNIWEALPISLLKKKLTVDLITIQQSWKVKFSKLRTQTGCTFQIVIMIRLWEQFLRKISKSRKIFFPFFFFSIRSTQARPEKCSEKLSNLLCVQEQGQWSQLQLVNKHSPFSSAPSLIPLSSIGWKLNLQQICCFCGVLDTSLMLLVALWQSLFLS